jgi:hypothetical protein
MELKSISAQSKEGFKRARERKRERYEERDR